MKTRRARRSLGVLVLVCSAVLGWSVMVAGDFYVIPVKSGATCTGDATVGDVREGKTFSNSTSTGLTGTLQVPTCTGSPVPNTGQTMSYRTGDDGDLGEGVGWPNPRFTDNGNGTVTGNLTGLVWTKNANCDGTKNWNQAIDYCNGLSTGTCGLSDGSSAGDWRLPNVREIHSLIHYGFSWPALPNTAGTGQWTAGDPFTNVESSWFWSSTTLDGSTHIAWIVSLRNGGVDGDNKVFPYYAWCVRGGP